MTVQVPDSVMQPRGFANPKLYFTRMRLIELEPNGM